MTESSSNDQKTQQQKWDQRYQQKTQPGNPCWVLENNLHLLPKQGAALDLASGLGANALTLAKHRLTTFAWDISSIALEKIDQFATEQNLNITTEQRDVESNPPEANSFDVIVVSQFLYRPIFPDLIKALKPNGLIFYQTFNQQKLSNSGPSSPDYLLEPNELLKVFSELSIRFYREDSRAGDLEQGRRDSSYLVAERG